MNSTRRVFYFRGVAMALVTAAVLTVAALAQVQPAPAAGAVPNTGFCGGRSLCFEGANFAATISEFRTSEANGFKIIDAMMHFQNKTNQPLVLGYVDGSASAIDDRGNRFTLNPYGNNGVRGMGVISGNNMDPKFILPPGGGADARFELLERLGQLQGVNYETELSIREINRIEGNQYVLGAETLMHYQGLANGMGVAAPAASGGQMAYTPAAGQTPCGSLASTAGSSVSTANNIAGATNSAAIQNTTSNATNQISNASNALSGLGSLFGHKKAAAPANAPTVASASPCPTTNVVGASPAGSPVYSSAPVVNSVSPQQLTPASNAGVYSPAMKSTVVAQPAPTAGSARIAGQPVKAAAQPVVTAPVRQAVQPAAVQQAKTPAQPVKAVARTPVPPPATKKVNQ